MGTKHTPGPWLVMNTSDVFTDLAAKAADGRSTAKDDGWHIADCAPGGSYVDGGGGLHELSLDEIKANARLIAAAPELYDALRELLTDMVIAQGNMRKAAKRDPAWEGCAEIIQPRVDAARAAIAKAEGK